MRAEASIGHITNIACHTNTSSRHESVQSCSGARWAVHMHKANPAVQLLILAVGQKEHFPPPTVGMKGLQSHRKRHCLQAASTLMIAPGLALFNVAFRWPTALPGAPAALGTHKGSLGSLLRSGGQRLSPGPLRPLARTGARCVLGFCGSCSPLGPRGLWRARDSQTDHLAANQATQKICSKTLCRDSTHALCVLLGTEVVVI